jgi:sugar phosphate isomerase/epimerase
MTEAADLLLRAGVSQSTTAPWTLAEDTEAYAAAGWAAIGVWLHKLERPVMDEFWFPEAEIPDATVDEAAAAIRDAGLAASHLVLVGRFVDPDEGTRRQRIEHGLDVIRIAERLGTRCVVVVPGRLNGLSAAAATDLAAAGLTELLERSAECAVPLAIEPVKEVDFTTTLDEALDLVELVDHPRLGVFPDVFQLWRDPGLEEAYARSSGLIHGVHIADSPGAEGDTKTRVAPGEGAIPIAEHIEAIEAAGYEGTYDVELFTMGSPPEEAAATLERCAAGMRELVGRLPAAR